MLTVVWRRKSKSVSNGGSTIGNAGIHFSTPAWIKIVHTSYYVYDSQMGHAARGLFSIRLSIKLNNVFNLYSVIFALILRRHAQASLYMPVIMSFLPINNFWIHHILNDLSTLSLLLGWLSGRTSVSDRRTFTGLHRTCSNHLYE